MPDNDCLACGAKLDDLGYCSVCDAPNPGGPHRLPDDLDELDDEDLAADFDDDDFDDSTDDVSPALGGEAG